MLSKFVNTYESAYGLAGLLALTAAIVWTLNIQGFEAREGAVVAIVNDNPIPQAEYVRALDAMQAGLARPLGEDDKARALNILIDEELMVQHALRLDLAHDDRLIRKNLVQVLMTSAVSQYGAEPTEEQLRDFFEAEPVLFARPRQVSLSVARMPSSGKPTVFIKALEDGLSFDAARKKADFERIDIAPEIPLGKVGDLLGGGVRDAIIPMRAGDIIGPVSSSNGQLFIWMTSSRGGPRPYPEAREGVMAEWRRRQDEAALEKYIKRLRKGARIKRLPPVIDE